MGVRYRPVLSPDTPWSMVFPSRGSAEHDRDNFLELRETVTGKNLDTHPLEFEFEVVDDEGTNEEV